LNAPHDKAPNGTQTQDPAIVLWNVLQANTCSLAEERGMGPPWSATRARTFQECRRKYYYRYHLAPLGRKPDAPREAQQAHRVKDLIGVEAWAGELVHTLIQRILTAWRCGRHVTEEDVAEQAKRLLSRQFRDSHD
jgi:hypothetical protein